MSWKTACRSFYYADAEEPDDVVLPPSETAHLCIDVQDYYLKKADESFNVVVVKECCAAATMELDEASSFFTA